MEDPHRPEATDAIVLADGVEWQVLDLPGGAAAYARRFLAPDDAGTAFEQLMAEVDWRAETIVVHGRPVPQPRLTAWFSDSGSSYRYSRLTLESQPWHPVIGDLRGRAERATGARLPVVLANLYRDGRDSVGWHADDEPELGSEPVIASISLGATRRFHLRRADDAGERRTIDLTHGSLLVMWGPTQRHWRHQVPKTSKPVGPRINLTYRTRAG